MIRFTDMNPDKMTKFEFRLHVLGLRSEVEFLGRLTNVQTKLISELRKENKRLKTIDQALQDFNFEKYHKARDTLAREGFDAVIANRSKQKSFQR